MGKHLVSMVASSILQLFWIRQSSWTCIRWVFSWIYHSNLSHRLFTEFSRTQAGRAIVKITERISVTIITLTTLIVLRLICNQSHVQPMLVINQRLSVLEILGGQSLKQDLIPKLRIILRILFSLSKTMRVLLNCGRRSTKDILQLLRWQKTFFQFLHLVLVLNDSLILQEMFVIIVEIV